MVVDYEKLGKVRERNKGCRLQPCDGYIGNGYDMRVSSRGDYCKYCGQKIDWKGADDT